MQFAQGAGLTPAKFWRMLPRDYDLLVLAEKDKRLFRANLTANLMNCWLKRPVTGEQLLGIKPGGGKWASQMTAEEKKAQRERIRESLRKRRAQGGGS